MVFISPFTNLSALALTVMIGGLFLASLARGYSGFGFSAVLVSSWSLVTDPSKAIALALVMEVVASTVQAFSVWRDIPWKRVGLLLAGAVIGTPMGVYLLSHIPLAQLRIGISGFVLVSVFALLAGWKLKKRATGAGTSFVGLASGIANGAVGMGGLPVALFLTADGDSPARIRAAVTAYFFFLDIIGLIFLAQSDLVGLETLTSAVLAFPVLLIGMALGTGHFLGATAESFRKITLFMLLGIALIGIARTLLS